MENPVNPSITEKNETGKLFSIRAFIIALLDKVFENLFPKRSKTYYQTKGFISKRTTMPVLYRELLYQVTT